MRTNLQQPVVYLNAITFVLFLMFFGYTFLAKSHLEGLARAYVIEKTVEHSEPVVAVLEKLIDVPLATVVLPKEDIRLVRDEIQKYQKNPSDYVAGLVRRGAAQPDAAAEGIPAKVAAAKRQIRNYYDDTLASLISDLRIFSGNNVLAAGIAIACCLKQRGKPPLHLICYSVALFVAVLYCSYLYVDGLTFFRILTRTYPGWYYPLFVLGTAGWLLRTVANAAAAVSGEE